MDSIFPIKVEIKSENPEEEIHLFKETEDWCIPSAQNNNNDECGTVVETEGTDFTIISTEQELKEFSKQTCSVCNINFNNSFKLLQHKLKHLRVMVTKCDISNKATRHKKNGAVKSERTCHKCNKTYKYKNWFDHLKQVHSKEKFVCDICKRCYQCRKYLRIHIQIVHGFKRVPKKPKLVSCPNCNVVLKSPNALTTHIRNVHSKSVTCHICQSVLKSKSYLRTHILRVHFDDGKDHPCGLCPKKFKSPRYLRVHIKNTHERKIICFCCKEQFADAVKLEIHVLKTHERELLLNKCMCRKCGQTYKNFVNLQSHCQRMHKVSLNSAMSESDESNDGESGLEESLRSNYEFRIREIKIEEM